MGTDNYIFFLRGPLSNWHRCQITFLGSLIENALCLIPHEMKALTFYSSEQLFMYLKALHFNDGQTAKLIYEANTPTEAKSLGRKVQGFDEDDWKEVRETYMEFCLSLKYINCREFRGILDDSGNMEFVECNPRDQIWGIGLSETDKKILDPKQWRGLNLLGKCITKVRDHALMGR